MSAVPAHRPPRQRSSSGAALTYSVAMVQLRPGLALALLLSACADQPLKPVQPEGVDNGLPSPTKTPPPEDEHELSAKASTPAVTRRPIVLLSEPDELARLPAGFASSGTARACVTERSSPPALQLTLNS